MEGGGREVREKLKRLSSVTEATAIITKITYVFKIDPNRSNAAVNRLTMGWIQGRGCRLPDVFTVYVGTASSWAGYHFTDSDSAYWFSSCPDS